MLALLSQTVQTFPTRSGRCGFYRSAMPIWTDSDEHNVSYARVGAYELLAYDGSWEVRWEPLAIAGGPASGRGDAVEQAAKFLREHLRSLLRSMEELSSSG